MATLFLVPLTEAELRQFIVSFLLRKNNSFKLLTTIFFIMIEFCCCCFGFFERERGEETNSLPYQLFFSVKPVKEFQVSRIVPFSLENTFSQRLLSDKLKAFQKPL